jgi:hypothetical protein
MMLKDFARNSNHPWKIFARFSGHKYGDESFGIGDTITVILIAAKKLRRVEKLLRSAQNDRTNATVIDSSILSWIAALECPPAAIPASL